MSETQTDFLQRQVISLTKENHLLKEDILAFQHFLNNRVKELKSYLRDIPGRYLNMELCDITQILSFVKEDMDHYQQFIHNQAHEVKQLKTQYSEIRDQLHQQQEQHKQQINNVEASLTEQYTKALKELQDNFAIVTSNSDIYRKSMNSLVQEKQLCEKQVVSLQEEIQKNKKQYEKEKNEFVLTIKRGKQQLTDLEKVYTMRLHKVQQSNFEEYQTKLKMQAKDQTEKDQQRIDLEKKLLAFENYYSELQQDYEKLHLSFKDEQESNRSKQADYQLLYNANCQLLDNSKLQDHQISELKLQNSRHLIEQEKLQSGLQQHLKTIEQQNELLYQVLQELNQVTSQKNDIMKQSSIKTQIMIHIKQIGSKYQTLLSENTKINQQLVKLQDQCVYLQEEQNQLIFQNEMFQQKNSQLQEQIQTQQEFEIKYRKIVNEIVYLGQTNPAIIKNIQKSVSVDFYKEYSILNQITDNDQNRPLFLLAPSLESVEDIAEKKKTDNFEDKSQQYDRVNTVPEVENKSLHFIEIHEEEQSYLEQNQSFQWKHSIRMTLTPSVCQKQEEIQQQAIILIDVSTQTDRKKYHSKFLPHDNLDEIVGEIKAGYAAYIDTIDMETQTFIELECKSTQTTLKKIQSIEEVKEVKINSNIQIQSKNNEQNTIKQLENQQNKVLQLNKVIQQLELKLQESLFLNDKLTEDYEMKARELSRIKENSKHQLQDQMIEYENKLSSLTASMNLTIENLQQQIKHNQEIYLDSNQKLLNQIIVFEKDILSYQDTINLLKDNIQQKNTQLQGQKQLFHQLETKSNLEISQLQQSVKQIQLQFDNRPSLLRDVETINKLENENTQLQETIQKNFAKIEHANEIVKYLQIEVENYKKQYNLFTNHKPRSLQKKKIVIEPTIEDEKSLVFDSKVEFLPTVTNREQFSNSKNTSQRKRAYRLSDFEIKQHTTKYFFKSNNPNHNLNKTQLIERTNSPSSKKSKYPQTTQRKFNNPFENDCILHNAELLVENIKGGTPVTKQTQKSNDQFFLKGSLIQAEQNSTCQSKQRI